jgi:hypothetical protein
MRTLEDEEWVTKTLLTKIGTSFFTINGCLFFLFDELKWLIIFEVLIFVCSLFVLKKYLLVRHETRLLIGFEELLGQLAIVMKRGESFRGAMSTVMDGGQGLCHKRISEIWRSVYFSQHIVESSWRPSELRILRSLVSLDQQSYGVIQRCDFFRHQLSIERKFRQKSGEVLWQPRYQAIMLGTMYGVLCCFVPISFGWTGFENFFVPSFVLFTIGTVLLLRINRKFRWTW